MGCLDEQTVVAFVSGALVGARLIEVERHLLQCPDCSTLIAHAAPAAGTKRTTTLEWAGLPPTDEMRARAASETSGGGGSLGSVTEVIEAVTSIVDPGSGEAHRI